MGGSYRVRRKRGKSRDPSLKSHEYLEGKDFEGKLEVLYKKKKPLCISRGGEYRDGPEKG